jgi:hypothetical protein
MFAPRKKLVLLIRHASVRNVINELRQECRDPRTRSPAEASDQLIAPDGEITRRCRELLLITLCTRAKERGS